MGECWHWHSLIFTTNNLWPTFIPEYCGKFVENVPIIICIKNWFVLFFALFLDIRSYPLIVADNNHTLLEKGKHVRRYWKKSPGPTFIESRSENLKNASDSLKLKFDQDWCLQTLVKFSSYFGESIQPLGPLGLWHCFKCELAFLFYHIFKHHLSLNLFFLRIFEVDLSLTTVNSATYSRRQFVCLFAHF